MSLKEQIKQFHENFSGLLSQRNNCSTDDGDKCLEIDQQLLAMIRKSLDKDIPFSQEMDEWVPASVSLEKVINENKEISSPDGLITIKEALALKAEKERKFKKVQNISMLACTVLLLLYYIIVTWIL